MNTLICFLAVTLAEPPALPLQCKTPIGAKGDIKAGGALAHTFDLTHRGSGTLSIVKVEAGCGCLRQSLSAAVLSQGETTKLSLEVNTLTQPDGPNRWQVTVGYKIESPGVPVQTGELLLQITANLTREISVTPPQIAISTTGSASHSLTVVDRRSAPLTVKKVVTTSAHLSAEVAPRDKEKGQAVAIKLAADAPAGQRDEVVTLLTDDPVYPELRVPVRILKRVPGTVQATPEAVSVRFAAGQTELSTLVQIRTVEGKSISIASAESDLPGIIVKPSTGSGPTATVRITVTETAGAQAGNAKVRVRMADPAGQEVAISVAWTGLKK